MIDDDYGAVGGIRIGRGNRSTRRKPALVPLCPSQIPHDLTWHRTRAAAVESQRLTAWAMARPRYLVSLFVCLFVMKQGSYPLDLDIRSLRIYFFSFTDLLHCSLLFRRTGWCSVNPLDSYSGGARFESRPEHRLFWLKCFVVTLSFSRQMPG
jgi:hypothetical protein